MSSYTVKTIQVAAKNTTLEVAAKTQSTLAIPAETIEIGTATILSPNYTHLQTVPSQQWIVNHNLGYYPVIAITTLGGLAVLADPLHLSVNHFQLNFTHLVSGVCRCL